MRNNLEYVDDPAFKKIISQLQIKEQIYIQLAKKQTWLNIGEKKQEKLLNFYLVFYFEKKTSYNKKIKSVHLLFLLFLFSFIPLYLFPFKTFIIIDFF